jgi:acetaldehyde dehydrogenase (acetylating)
VTQQHPELARRIDIIERGYEYLLAFAAQGRMNEAGSEVRETLLGMHAALEGIDRILMASTKVDARSQRHDASAFIAAVRDDALKAGGAIAFTLNCAAIGSQLIDNLNASIHVRALLTDLFLADQALRQNSGTGSAA